MLNLLSDPDSLYTKKMVTFTKNDISDPTHAENQDHIAEGVRITRGDSDPLYNAASEDGYVEGVSPEGTMWAMGETSAQSSYDYQILFDAVGGSFNNIVGQTMSLHLVELDIYFDVTFNFYVYVLLLFNTFYISVFKKLFIFVIYIFIFVFYYFF